MAVDAISALSSYGATDFSRIMNRRTFLSITGTGMLLITAPKLFSSSKSTNPMPEIISKTEAEWRQILTPEQFHILREEGTEPPHSSPLNKEHREGIYHCAGCDLELFSSKMKFDSGTGWPSFFTSIDANLATKRDFKLFLPRTEYHCSRCGGHQGHIFDDGPEPTGQRWCNNGLALQFVPA